MRQERRVVLLALILVSALAVHPHAAAQMERKLNNLVTELFRAESGAASANSRVTFQNPRDGWVHVSIRNDAQPVENVTLIVEKLVDATSSSQYALDGDSPFGSSQESVRQFRLRQLAQAMV